MRQMPGMQMPRMGQPMGYNNMGVRPGMQQMQMNPMMGMNNMARPPFNAMQQQNGYKIGSNVRNAQFDQQANMNMMANNAQNAVNNQTNPGQAGDNNNVNEANNLNMANLARMDKNDQKQAIGEQLYPKVKDMVQSEEKAGKITGMLLELDNEDLLTILEPMAQMTLKEKVDEAAQVLVSHAGTA
jgi:polyadenylate-binding protein